MEAAILEAETRRDACERAIADPDVASDAGALQARYAELEAVQDDITRLYTRWAELEQKA
jgi:hypothetical protein